MYAPVDRSTASMRATPSAIVRQAGNGVLHERVCGGRVVGSQGQLVRLERLEVAQPILTDEDLQYAEGQEEDLVGRLQQKLGKGKREITKMLNDL